MSVSLVLLIGGGALAHESTPHCATGGNGIIGLIADNHYHVKPGKQAPPHEADDEVWMLRDDLVNPGPCSSSFTGTYMQVPDRTGTSYASHNRIDSPETFESITALSFKLRITEPGIHSLFVRWTAGDTVGGGDSLYVVLYDANQRVVAGVPTYKPGEGSISGDGKPDGQFAGACYSMTTHAMSCVEAGGGITQEHGPEEDCDYWVNASVAGAQYNLMCPLGHGMLEAVPHPRWYLFSGQAFEHALEMDFDVEPWDATCQAEADGTSDSGYDYPQYDLQPGEYSLVFYPREDGTCLDAWYMTTPQNATAPNGLRLSLGGSTVHGCDAPYDSKGHSSASSLDGGAIFGLIILGALLGAAAIALVVHVRMRAGKQPLPWAGGATASPGATQPRLTTVTDSASTQYISPQIAMSGGARPEPQPTRGYV